MIDPAVGALILASLALLFATASWHKLRSLAEFEAVLVNYRLVPGALAPLLRLLVPALELGIAIGLLLAPTREAAALTGIVVLLGYAAAIGINLARNRRDLDCGCGPRRDRRSIAAWMVGRNLVLAAVLGGALLPSSGRALEAVDALTIGGSVAILALLYVAIDQLLGEVRPRAAALRRPA